MPPIVTGGGEGRWNCTPVRGVYTEMYCKYGEEDS